MRTIQKFFKDMLTGVDGHTFDIGRVMYLGVNLAYLGLTIYALYKHEWTFDPLTWCSGEAAITAGLGFCLYAKAGTEPPPTAMMIRSGNTVFKQAVGRPPIGGGCDDGDDAPTPLPDAPDPSSDDPAPTTTATISATVSAPVGK